MRVKKVKTNKLVIFMVFLCALCVFDAGASPAADFPRSQIDEAERHFNEAYARLLTRDYWGADDYLSRALRANTYMVDYYLLHGLAMNRTGDYNTGRESLSHYLEVRPMDSTTPRILSYIIAQQRELRRLLSPAPLPSAWRVSNPDLQAELRLGMLRQFNAKGLGKADASGGALCIADTFGDSVYFVKQSQGSQSGVKPVNISAVSPAATMTTGDGLFYIVSTSGDVHSFTSYGGASGEMALVSPDFIGRLENGRAENSVADAAPISAAEFAVADTMAREVGFYSFGTLSNADSRAAAWSPPEETDEEMLFEPVALSVYGPWLAVADRGGEKIFFVNLTTARRDFFSVEVPRPRDIAWSGLGELFVINEDGSLFTIVPDFREGRAESPELVERGVRDGWTLFGSPDGNIYCVDIAASKLWKAMPMPDTNTSLAFLSVASPALRRVENAESFVLQASMVSPFAAYLREAKAVAYGVWNNRTISSQAIWRPEPRDKRTELAVFHRPALPGAVHPALNAQTAETGTDIQIALPSIWDARRGTLTNILVDSSIIFAQDELDFLALFCMNNGLGLNIWARSIPSVEMLRASAFTGGSVVYSIANEPDITFPRNQMQIFIPLPQELSSSGYPSRSMLTVYLDVGLMNARDWIPLWPDMLE